MKLYLFLLFFLISCSFTKKNNFDFDKKYSNRSPAYEDFSLRPFNIDVVLPDTLNIENPVDVIDDFGEGDPGEIISDYIVNSIVKPALKQRNVQFINIINKTNKI